MSTSLLVARHAHNPAQGGYGHTDVIHEVMDVVLSGGTINIEYDEDSTATYNTNYVHNPKYCQVTAQGAAQETGYTIDTTNKYITVTGEGTSTLTVLIIGYALDKN